VFALSSALRERGPLTGWVRLKLGVETFVGHHHRGRGDKSAERCYVDMRGQSGFHTPARVPFQNMKQLSFRPLSRQKIVTILFAKSFRFKEGEPPMRIKQAIIFVCSTAALTSVTAPVLAKNSNAQKTSEQSACSAAQQMADRTWLQSRVGPRCLVSLLASC
jgi:hypothetical protein